MIEKLSGRNKIIWLTVSNKVNEIIDLLNSIEEEEIRKKEEQKKRGIKNE